MKAHALSDGGMFTRCGFLAVIPTIMRETRGLIGDGHTFGPDDEATCPKCRAELVDESIRRLSQDECPHNVIYASGDQALHCRGCGMAWSAL